MNCLPIENESRLRCTLSLRGDLDLELIINPIYLLHFFSNINM